MFTASVEVEVGEAGLRAIVEAAETGDLSSPVLYVVIRSLARSASTALESRPGAEPKKVRPKTIVDMRRTGIFYGKPRGKVEAQT